MSNNQVIPEAAVEAAARAFIEHGTLLPALEAAAPHMVAVCDGGYTCPSAAHIEGCFRPHVENELLAKAWDGGRTHGARYPYGERGLATDDNPYRSQA